jgi:thiol-disulfide isomerase/thioredoxin
VARPRGHALSVGFALVAVTSAGLAGNAAWAARHLHTLKPLTHGEPAPDFRLPRGDGKPGTLGLSELRGRVVVLDFWATWCGPCLAMMPKLHELDREWRDRGVSILGVNSDGNIDPAVLSEFLLTHEVSYPRRHRRGHGGQPLQGPVAAAHGHRRQGRLGAPQVHRHDEQGLDRARAGRGRGREVSRSGAGAHSLRATSSTK